MLSFEKPFEIDLLLDDVSCSAWELLSNASSTLKNWILFNCVFLGCSCILWYPFWAYHLTCYSESLLPWSELLDLFNLPYIFENLINHMLFIENWLGWQSHQTYLRWRSLFDCCPLLLFNYRLKFIYPLNWVEIVQCHITVWFPRFPILTVRRTESSFLF